MIAFRLLAVSTILLLAYCNVQVKCQGEETWTNANNPSDDINQAHSTEPSHNGQGLNEEDQAAEHSNLGVSPPYEGAHNGEQDSSRIDNTVTESSNGYGLSDNPLETNMHAPTNDEDWEKAEHKIESTSSDGDGHPSPTNQWSSEATTEGEGHGWTNGNDLQGNGRTDGSGVTSSADGLDEHGENHQQKEGLGTDTTPGEDHRWNNTDDPQGHWASDSGDSQITTSIHGQTESWNTDMTPGGNHGWITEEPQGHSPTEFNHSQITSNENHNEHGLTEHDYISPGGTTPSIDEQGGNHQQTVSWGADTTTGEDHHGNSTDNPQGQWSTDYGDSQTTSIHGLTESWETDTSGDDHHWNSTDDPHVHSSTESSDSRVTTSIENDVGPSHGLTTPSGSTLLDNGQTDQFGSDTTLPGDRSTTNIDGTTVSEGRPDGSGTLTTRRNTDHMGSGTPENPDVTTTRDDNDYSWRNDDPTTSSYDDNVSDSPPHYDDPQYDGQSPPPDYDQVTLGNDYGEIPEDDTDEAGNELVASCKKESNYQGDFHDPNESSTELKCFYACAMVKMEVMNEDNGQMQLNMQTTVNTIEDAFGDNAEMIEKYKNAVSACDQEVPKGGDRCEYAFNFINCGIQKVQ